MVRIDLQFEVQILSLLVDKRNKVDVIQYNAKLELKYASACFYLRFTSARVG